MRGFPLLMRLAVLLGVLIGLCPLTAPASVTEVTFMVDPVDLSRPAWQALSDEFNATHSDIRFRIFWSNLQPKLNLLSVAGALPDLVSTADFKLVLIHDNLIDLDDFLKQMPESAAQYYPQLVDSCRYDGTLKMIPIRYNVPFIYYRPDLFRKAGLAEPAPSWTWDDYRRDAKALTERNPDGSIKIYGTNIQALWWVEWLGLFRQAGADALTPDGKVAINSAGTLQALRFMHDLIYVDRSAPRPVDALPTGFENGKIAIYYGGHVKEFGPLRKSAPFEWDIAPLPAGPQGQATGDLAVEGIGISKQCRHPREALEVLRFITSKKSSLALVNGGFIAPVRKDVAQETLLAGTPETRTVAPRHVEVLFDSLVFARSVPKLREFDPVWKALNNRINHVLNDPDDSHLADLPPQLAADAQTQLDLMRTPATANPWYFVVQMVLMGGIALWLLQGTWRKPASAEERAGQKYFFLFTAPCLVGLCLFTLWPLLLSFWWAQTDYNLVDTPHYVGLAQYRELLFEDHEFWQSLGRSLLYALFAVPLGLAVSLGTALLLNQNLRHIGAFRVLFYLPSILPVAASSMMWIWLLYPNYGIVNRMLAVFGVAGPGWLQDARWALPSLVIISLWGFGGAMLIFLAGLKDIPDSLYEAAQIDGAGKFSQFLHITLPSLSPVVFFNLTMGLIGALQVFDIAFIVSTSSGGEDAAGGPENSTNFYVLYLYTKSFTKLQIGSGSAMAWLFFGVILLITGVNFWVKRYWIAPETERA
jgi:multiple sugar transport system permease protein